MSSILAMFASSVSGFLLILLIGQINANQIRLEDGVWKNLETNNMTLVGQVGSKVYLRSVREDMNWLAAESACRGAGLNFAKLENSAEFNYVQSQLPSKKFWVGAQLSGQQAMGGNNNILRGAFEWNDGTAFPNTESGVNFLIMSPAWLCIYFYNHVLYPGPCFEGPAPALCHISL